MPTGVQEGSIPGLLGAPNNFRRLGSESGAIRMISQSITFPQPLWERLFDSHSHKACGNDVAISKYFKSTKVIGTSVPTKVVGILYL